MNEGHALAYKQCAVCGQRKTAAAFQRRTGRTSGPNSRRGTCKSCAKRKRKAVAACGAATVSPPAVKTPRESVKAPVVSAKTPEAPLPLTSLKPTGKGVIRMRGRTDKGRRWHQEIDLELAQTLVRERAAVMVNPHTIRRLFTNKDFRQYVLTRDRYTCHYCGGYGDTIDHLLPRAKGGHTTPDNCVCACQACNQSKADQDFAEFVGAGRQA